MAGWLNYSSPDRVPVCQNQAGACGHGPRVTTTMTQNVNASTAAAIFSGNNVDGSCTQCPGSAPSPWGADALWEVNVTSTPPTVLIRSFQWSSDFMVPAGSTYQALEWDSQQTLVGLDPGCTNSNTGGPGASVMNYGMQYDLGDFGSPGHWRFFDYGGGHWVDTGVTSPNPADGAWHSIAVNWTIAQTSSGTTTTLNSVTVDGVTTNLSVNNKGSAGCRPYDNSVSMGLQLDNVPGSSYTASYNNYNATWSTDAPPPSCSTIPTITEPFDGETVGSAINLHVTADSCVEAMNVYIDDQLVQNITGNASPVPPSTTNWIWGYSEGVWHRLVVVGYSTGHPDGASSTVNFIWP
jgi:hypothetical protein